MTSCFISQLLKMPRTVQDKQFVLPSHPPGHTAMISSMQTQQERQLGAKAVLWGRPWVHRAIPSRWMKTGYAVSSSGLQQGPNREF
jgi:hypothetical protein